jgi:hypothetical protein
MRTKYLFQVLLMFTGIVHFGCKDKAEPNPLESAAGVYKGNVADGAVIFQNIQANVTVEKGSNGVVFIKSVGLTGSAYQLVLTSPSNAYSYTGKRGTISYSAYPSDVSVSGGTLNVKGTSGSSTAFSFTGTKQ